MDGKTAHKVFDYLDKINHNIESYREEITEFKDAIYTRIDDVMTELQTTRGEQIVASDRTSQLEDRVDAIEKMPAIAHSIKK